MGNLAEATDPGCHRRKLTKPTKTGSMEEPALGRKPKRKPNMLLPPLAHLISPGATNRMATPEEEGQVETNKETGMEVTEEIRAGTPGTVKTEVALLPEEEATIRTIPSRDHTHRTTTTTEPGKSGVRTGHPGETPGSHRTTNPTTATATTRSMRTC